MSESISLTINQSERAELEALLELWRTEFEQGKAEHEKIEARIESYIRETKRHLSYVRANLEKSCGKL